MARDLIAEGAAAAAATSRARRADSDAAIKARLGAFSAPNSAERLAAQRRRVREEQKRLGRLYQSQTTDGANGR